MFILYRKSDGRVESYSEGPIDYNEEKLAHTTADIPDDILNQISQGNELYLQDDILIAKEPPGSISQLPPSIDSRLDPRFSQVSQVDLQSQIESATTLDEIKTILLALTS